jgi:Tfp pilus assembly protein PilW
VSGVLRGLRARTGRRDTGRPDAGVSVVELAVTAAVGMLVLAGVATVAVGSLTAVRSIAVRTGTSADARIAGETLTRSLRVAVRPKGEAAALVSATPTSVTFYALLNTSGSAQTTDAVPSMVELGWTGSCLTRRITAGSVIASPSSSGPFYTWTPAGSATCVARTTLAPAYGYYATAAISTGGVDTTPLSLSGGSLSATERRSVSSVEVRLTVVDARYPSVPGAPAVARVTLANVLTDAGGL